MTLDCIKNARFDGDRLCGRGYALGPRLSFDAGACVVRVGPLGVEPCAVVFGFDGVGCHYRCEVMPDENLVLLHALIDGIPVYLHHASLSLAAGSELLIECDREAVRMALDGVVFLNVLGVGFKGGRYGFAVDGEAFTPPRIAAESIIRGGFEWVCLGDGYSNNSRWKNRHFFSWPELAFGGRGRHLNACVAAGNTRRVCEVAEAVSHRVGGAVVMIAAGADDLIEGVAVTEFLGRMEEIVGRVMEAGAGAVHVCAIPPRQRRDDEVVARNLELQALGTRMGADGFVDFYQILKPGMAHLIVNGDYPGAAAQRLLAEGVLRHLGLPGGLAPLVEVERLPKARGIVGRLAARVGARIDSALGELPAVSVI